MNDPMDLQRRRHKDQLFLWRDVIAEEMKKDESEDLITRCITVLLEKDELFRAIKELKEDEQETEYYFIKHSIQGFLEYLSFPKGR